MLLRPDGNWLPMLTQSAA